MLSRRKFIEISSLSAAATFLQASSCNQVPQRDVGIQLYSLRKIIDHSNLGDVLRRCARIGYKSVELFGQDAQNKFWGHKANDVRLLLQNNGLVAPSAHIDFDNFLVSNNTENFKGLAESVAAVGCNYMVVAWVNEQHRKSPAAYTMIADKLNQAGRIAKNTGLQLAYHNHDFEFVKFDNKTTGYEILLANTDTALIKMELDLYWCVKAGVDPVYLLGKHQGRFPLWHVKDMDAISKHFTEVGTGSIDFKKIFKHAGIAGLQHFFVEQDEVAVDEFSSIQKSLQYVQEELLPILKDKK